MKIYRLAKDEKPDNYKEMKDWFIKRTDRHVKLVQKYCKKIEEYNPKMFKGLIERAKTHDESKYKDPEIEPYIYTTWSYKCKDDGMDFKPPEGMDEKMNKATEHHVKSNLHHPESHCEKKVDLINKTDRDKPPEEMIDATKMKDIDIGEMLADWLSMSEEKSTNPNEWADNNVNVRWKFTNDHRYLIYELIEEIWK